MSDRNFRPHGAMALASLLATFACQSPALPGDAGDVDATAATCGSRADCDDGLFCNGVERCLPGDPSADVSGCAPAELPACEAPATCNELERRCVEGCADLDGDGHGPTSCGGDDCDDEDARRHPGAPEVCDAEGVDEDCDTTTFGVRDVDGDGVTSSECCNGTTCGPDCDDVRAGVNPSAPEVCNELDDDCDGASDEALLVALYLDADHDGVGDAAREIVACPGAPGAAAASGDCDDSRASVRPTAPEICDELDNDCDSIVDESTVAVPWYVDRDGDGWGVVSADDPSIDSCVPPAERAIRIGDCDDADAAVSPTARERCNGLDDDCDGRADFVIAAGDREDDDLDGVPDARCMVAAADCDDRDPYTSLSSSPELCDDRDNDCDGTVDEETAARDWYLDSDGDRAGDPAMTIASCEIVPGRVLGAGDCDDDDPGAFPGASDGCSGRLRIDDDCDGAVDEAGQALTLYLDLDGDGYGSGEPIRSCLLESRTAPRAGDCDDAEARVSPGALDDCAAIAMVDDDCDGRVDETLTPRTFFADADGDGYGAGAPSTGCAQPPGTATASGDCDDSDVMRNPGVPDDCATRVGVDDDCDVSVDEGRTLRSFYVDRDGDGYGAGPAMEACSAPAGTVAAAGDCDDDAPARNPGAPDDCSRTPLVDDDCDGAVDEAAMLTTFYADPDGDTYGSGSARLACTAPLGHVARDGDCDESSAARNPGRADDCTTALGVDDDCDGTTDEAVAMIAWFPDADGDGYGTGTAIDACTGPAGHAPLGGDCDDSLATRSPGRADDCTTTLGLDDDCDATIDEAAALATFYRDADGDGFGTSSVSTTACSAPAGHVSDATDCDDARAAVRPGATEVCNNVIDDDCDGALDCADTSCAATCGTIRIVSGDGQSAQLHALAAAPLIVEVVDGTGMPLSGRSVVLETTGVSSPTGLARLTDGSGLASFTLRAAPRVGAETFTVTSPGATDVDGTLTGTAPPDGTIFSLYNGIRDASALRGFPGPAWTSTTQLNPGRVATGPSGRVYFMAHGALRWIDPSGATGVLAGGGSTPLNDGVPATSASFGNTSGWSIAADEGRGRIYFAPALYCRAHVVDVAAGVITRVLGGSDCVDAGDGGLARDATTAQLHALSVAGSGALYVVSGYLAGNRLRVIDTAGVIRTLVTSSSGTPALRLNGTIYSVSAIPGSDDVLVGAVCQIAGGPNAQCVVRVDPGGNLSLVAGGGSDPVSEGVDATLAQLSTPFVTVTSSGEIVIAEGWDRIRRIALDGTISTIAGTRSMAGDTGEGGPATSALIDVSPGIAPWLGTHVVFYQTSAQALRVIW